MKQKLRVFLTLLLCVVASVGWASETTYYFTSGKWAAVLGDHSTSSNWTSGKDGGFTSNQGVQVTTNNTGANATSPISFENVSKVTVEYCTNTSKGKGTILIQVGEGEAKSFSVSAPSSGGTTLKSTDFSFNPAESGNVKITVNCTTNSIYIHSITITYNAGGTPTPTLSVSPTSIAFEDKAINGSYYETFDVTFANLTEDLTVSVGSGLTGVSVSPTTISKEATSPQTVTVTYAPEAVASISGNIIVSNNADGVSKTVAVTGSAFDPDDITYYKKVTSNQSDWSGDYIFTGINSSKYYALTGVNNNLGTTAEVSVTEDGIISNSTTNAYKVTIAPTTDGYSLYMAGVGYLSYSGTSNQLHVSNDFETSTCEWTISFANGVATITNVGANTRILQYNYNNGNPRFACYTSSQTKLTLFKLDDGTPSISADDVNIAYDAEDGSIEYTIVNPVEGTTLNALTTATWITLGKVGESSIPFTCSANETTEPRTATVTLTYGDVTKDVTVTQAAAPAALKTIAEVRTQDTGNVTTKGVVTSCVGITAYIQDATAAICVYGNELTVGDEIKVSGTLSTYKGLLEITEPEITVLSHNNTVNPEVMTIAQVNASTNQGWYVKIEDATVTELGSNNNVTIKQGENTIGIHFNNADDIAFEVNDIITLNGNIGYYNNANQIANPTNVVKKELTTVTLTFADIPATIVVNETATYTATADPEVTGITYQSSNENVVMVDANTGEIAALALGTATITASYAGDADHKAATASYTIEVVAPKHIAKFFVNGVEQTAAQVEVSEGAAITFPANPSAINNKEFVGWTDAKIDGEQDEAPSTLVKAANMGTADITYYAVFATQEGEGVSSTATLTETEIMANFTNEVHKYADGEVSYDDTDDGINWGASYNVDASDRPWMQLKKDATAYLKISASNNISEIKLTITSASNSSGGITDITKHNAFGGTVYLESEVSSTPSGALGSSDEITENVVTIVPTSNVQELYVQVSVGARIWGVEVTTGTPATYSGYCTAFDESTKSAYAAITATTVDGTTTRDVTFYYDTKKNSRAGEGVTIETIGTSTEYNTWAGQMLKTATFDASFIDYTDLTSTINFFNNCKNLETINGLTNLNTSNVTDMTQMFRYCSKLANLDLSGFNTSNVEYMTNMFAYSLLKNITFGSNFKTDKVKNMTGMFSNCRMTSLDLSHENTSNEPNKCKFNTANVLSMNDMFYYCINMTNLDVSNFNTENVKYMEATFAGLEKVTELDLSNFNTANVTDMRNMFSHHSSTLPLTTIWVGDGWNTDKVTGTSGNSMFLACYNLYGGEGTKCSYTNGTGVALARIDGKGGKGYLSDKNNKYVTVGSTGYTTYVPKANVTIPSDVTAYIVTEVKESSIHMEPVTGAIPAGTPIVVKADQNWYKLPIAESATAVSGNLLLASDGNVTGDGSTIYALGVGKEGDAAGKVGFYRVKNGATVPAGKAYLNASVVAKDFLNFDFGETDGIGQIEIGQTSNAEIYNLSGQKVNKAQKGIYIVNGKKIVIR